jgi:hypothetical protein
MIYFSPSTVGFYIKGIHKTIPDDVVEITNEKHAELLAAQSEGKTIIFKDGEPQAEFVDPNVTWEDVRFRRDNLIAKSDWTQFPDVQMDQELKQAWITYRQALRDITESFATPGEVVWPTTPTK